MGLTRYRMSMTAAGLMPEASVRLAEIYLGCRDWQIVRQRSACENILQANTANTSQRIGRELIDRLKTLSDDELSFLVAALDRVDRLALVWVAVCRHYSFLADFATEVLRDAYLMGRPQVTYEDYDRFFVRSVGLHSELGDLLPATEAKIRQVVFRMMTEAGLIDKAKNLIPAVLSPTLMRLLPESDFLFFPMFVKEGGAL